MILQLESVNAEIELEEPNLDKKDQIVFKYEILEKDDEYTDEEIKEAIAEVIQEALYTLID